MVYHIGLAVFVLKLTEEPGPGQDRPDGARHLVFLSHPVQVLRPNQFKVDGTRK